MPKFDDIAPFCSLLVSCFSIKSKEWYIAGEAHNWYFKKGVNNFSAPGYGINSRTKWDTIMFINLVTSDMKQNGSLTFFKEGSNNTLPLFKLWRTYVLFHNCFFILCLCFLAFCRKQLYLIIQPYYLICMHTSYRIKQEKIQDLASF